MKKSVFKKVLGLTVVLAMLMQCLGGIVFADVTLTGDGTSESPYLIGTYEQLAYFRDLVDLDPYTGADKWVTLTADIVIPEGVNWYPIGTPTAYSGTFDGAGHKITGFNQSATGWRAGFFRQTNGATIKNLTIEGSVVSTVAYVGGFVGEANNTTITNCKFIGDVTGVGGIVAGFIGRTDDGAFTTTNNTISNSIFVGNVTNSAASGSASGFAYSKTDVSNSYIVGDVTGHTEVAGVGFQATANNCFAYGTLTANTTNGYMCKIAATATNSYYLNAVTKHTAGQGTQASAYDFARGKIAYELGSAFGQTIGTDNHPVFATEDNAVILNENGEYINEGGEPLVYEWEISSYNDLAAFRDAVNSKDEMAMAGKVKLLADIEIPTGTNWTPIGTWTWAAAPFDTSKDAIFTGTFDGNGHKITNVVVDGLDSVWHAGFFRQTDGATIKNLTIEGNVGTLSDDGTYSIEAYAGGLIGAANGTTITNCKFKGNVYATNMAGGFIVRTDTATEDNNISNCVFEGTVQSGVGWASGFAFKNTNIKNSYYIGNVTGKTEVSAFGLWSGVKNSFVYGTVTATNGSAYPISNGKLSRDNVNDQTAVSNCYYSSAVATGSVGGLGTLAQMTEFILGKVCYLLNQNAGEVIYGQTIQQELYPTFFNNNMVYQSGDTYVNNAGAFAGVNAEKASVIASVDTYVMVAQYAKDGEVETLLAITPVNVSANQLYTQNMTPVSGASVYKVFVWDSIAGMKPVCSNAEYVIAQ